MSASFDAGSIDATADLDLTPFHRALDEADARGEAFASKRFTATLGVDDAEALRSLYDMTDRLDRYGERRDTARVRLDTDLAILELRRLQAELDLATRDRTIDIRANTTGGLGGGGGSGGGHSLLAALAGGAAVLGGPLGAVGGAGVLGAGLGAGVAATGGGAFLAGALPTIKAVTTAQTDLTTAQKAYNLAVLEGSKSGQHDALAKQKQILDSLTTSERAALAPLGALKAATKDYENALAPEALSLFTGALHTATDLLPVVTPLALAAGKALGGLFTEADKAVKSSEFRAVLAQLTTQVGPDITELGHIVGNLGGALVHAFAASGPLIKDVLHGLDQGTAALSRFTASSTFERFIAYAIQEAPVVGKALSSVGGALLAVVEGLAPLGDLILRVTPTLAHLITTVAPIAPELLTLWAAAKGASALGDVAKAVKLLDLTMRSTIIGAVVGLAVAFVTAYETSHTFRDEVNHDLGLVEQAFGIGLAAIIRGFKGLTDAWLTTIGAIVHGGADAFGWVPGVGGKLDHAAAAFDSFRGQVDSSLGGIADDAAGLGAAAGSNFLSGFAAGAAEAIVLFKAETALRNTFSKASASAIGGGGVRSASRSTDFDTTTVHNIVPAAPKKKTSPDDLTDPWGADPGAGGGGGGGAAGANAALVDYQNQISSGLAAAIKRGAPAVKQETISLRDTILKEFKDPAAASERMKALDLLAQQAPTALRKAQKNAEDAARVLGSTIDQALIKAVDNGSVLAEITRLEKQVTSTLKGVNDASERRTLLADLRAELPVLTSYATEYASLNKTLAADQKALTSLQDAATQFQQSTAQTLGAGASLSDAASSGQGLTAYLSRSLMSLQTFATELHQLKSAGIGNAALEMIVAAGPVQGGAIAKALLTSGTTGQASSLVDAIQALAGATATEAEQEIYSPQLDTLHADILALQGQVATLTKTVAATAATQSKTVSQGLSGVGRGAVRSAKSPVPRKQHLTSTKK